MAEILGLGCTHYPGLLQPDERLPGGFHHLLTAPNVPAQSKDRANWPDRSCWPNSATTRGVASGATLWRAYGGRLPRRAQVAGRLQSRFRADLGRRPVRELPRRHHPGVLRVSGLDEDFALKPWHNGNGGKPNRWDEPGDWTMKLRGAARCGEVSWPAH